MTYKLTHGLTRILLTLAALLTLSVAAHATDVTVTGLTFNGWQHGGTAAKLRAYASVDYTDSTGANVMRGTTGATSGFFRETNCTVASTTLSCTSFPLPSTDDALDNRDATWSLVLFDSTGRVRYETVADGWTLSVSWGGAVALGQWRAYVNSPPASPPTPGNPNYAQMNAAIASQLNIGNAATTSANGRVRLHSAAPDPAAPEVVVTNDPRLPTQGEKNAMAGTSGTPSSSNRFVTDSDLRLSAILPPMLLYASQLSGVTLDCNTATYAGTDNTSALQAAINTVSTYGTLLLIIDGKSVVTGLNLPSNVTLAGLNPGDGLCLKSGSNRAVLRNSNQTEGDLSLIADHDITLRNLTIYGNRDGQVKCNGSCVSGGEYVVGLQFFGVRNLHMEHVRIYASKNFAFHAANFDGVYIEDSTAEQPDYSIDNYDGFHFNGPGKNVRAQTKCVKTTDDCFAVDPFDPVDIHVGVTNGPITNVVATTIWENAFYGFRITASGSTYSDDVHFKGSGTIQSFALRLDNGGEYQGTAGAIRSVEADLQPTGFVSGVTTTDGGAVFVHGAVEQAKIKIVQNGGWYADYRPPITIRPSESVTNPWCPSGCTWQAGSFGSLDFDLDVYDPPGTNSAAAGSGYGLEVVGGASGHLRYKYNHRRDASVTQQNGALWFKGGTFVDAELSGSANRQNNLVAITSGGTSYLRFTNFLDYDDAGASVLISEAGGTITAYPTITGDLLTNNTTPLNGTHAGNAIAPQWFVNGRQYMTVGSALTVSGNAIAPTGRIHKVGAGLIKNITNPPGWLQGCFYAVPTAAFTTDATGNVSKASTAVVGQTMEFCYDGSKWNPSY